MQMHLGVQSSQRSSQAQPQQQTPPPRYALVPNRHIAASKDLRFADERYVTIGHMAVLNRIDAASLDLEELLLCDVENQRIKLLEFTKNAEQQPQSQQAALANGQKQQVRLRIASSVDCHGWPCAAVVMPGVDKNRIAVLETVRHRVVHSHVNLVMSFYSLMNRSSNNLLQVPPIGGGSRSVPSGSSGSSMEHSSFEDDSSTMSGSSAPTVPSGDHAPSLVLQEGDASWFGSVHVIPSGNPPQSAVLTTAFGFDRLYLLTESAAAQRFLTVKNQLRMPLDIFDFTYSAVAGLYAVLLSDETVRVYSQSWSLVQEVKLPRLRKPSSRRSSSISEDLGHADVANSYKILITSERKLLVAQLSTNSILCFDVATGEYHGVVAGDIVVVCWAATDHHEIFIYDLLTKFIVSYSLVKHVRRDLSPQRNGSEVQQVTSSANASN